MESQPPLLLAPGAVPRPRRKSRNRLDAAVPSASRTPPPPAAPARALAAPGGEADATLLELEARRGPRIEASFLVAILGIDASLVPRRGDLSTTGIYFEVAEPIGEVDMIQWLRIASTDRAQEIGLMAHVVRAVTLAGPGEVPAYGVALEFMPESEEATRSIEQFVAHVSTLNEVRTTAKRRPSGLSSRPPRSPSDAPSAEGKPSVRAMTIETTWQLAVGDRVRVEIAAPGMSCRVRLEGRATRVTPTSASRSGAPFTVDIELQGEVQRPRRQGSSMTFPAVRPDTDRITLRVDDGFSRTLDDLFSALIYPPPASQGRSRRDHLSGSLSRIRLPTLFALFDMERLSGTLVLRREEETATVFIDEGRLVDVEGAHLDLTPRARIGQLVDWEEGVFELSVGAVNRPDRVSMGTTALLIDLAREADERKANLPA